MSKKEEILCDRSYEQFQKSFECYQKKTEEEKIIWHSASKRNLRHDYELLNNDQLVLRKKNVDMKRHAEF